MFQIPAAPRGMPISWKNQYHGRHGESVHVLDLDKIDSIRSQEPYDWSAQIVPDANINCIDVEALELARNMFGDKHPNIKDEIKSWSPEKFLEKAKLMRNGKITRTALLLLGTEEASTLLSSYPAKLVWKLMQDDISGKLFYPPFLITTTDLYRNIRNLNLRTPQNDTLISREIEQYDRKSVLEALHNCIVHQDYELCGQITVCEFPDRLEFENLGNFYDGAPPEYIIHNRTPLKYRNTFLANAMAELNMIDILGSEIHKISKNQASGFYLYPNIISLL